MWKAILPKLNFDFFLNFKTKLNVFFFLFLVRWCWLAKTTEYLKKSAVQLILNTSQISSRKTTEQLILLK